MKTGCQWATGLNETQHTDEHERCSRTSDKLTQRSAGGFWLGGTCTWAGRERRIPGVRPRHRGAGPTKAWNLGLNCPHRQRPVEGEETGVPDPPLGDVRGVGLEGARGRIPVASRQTLRYCGCGRVFEYLGPLRPCFAERNTAIRVRRDGAFVNHLQWLSVC